VDFIHTHIFLNVTAPNPSSMFLSNYMHNPLDPARIAESFSTTIFLLFAVFITGTLVLPATGCPGGSSRQPASPPSSSRSRSPGYRSGPPGSWGYRDRQ